jgi:alpha-tubulin suppressor-like RCC1 family protein
MIPISFSNAGTVTQYIAISAGDNFSLAIKNDNTLWSGGFNSSGQLGLGNTTTVNTLNQVGSNNNWFLISAGDAHSLAMETSTGLWSTGRGLEGELGIGTWITNNTLQSIGCPTLALETIAKDTKTIQVYPNPTTNSLTVDYLLNDSATVVIRISNLQGQVIYEMKSEQSIGTQTNTIDISNEANGIYFLTLVSGTETQTVKIIKQ